MFSKFDEEAKKVLVNMQKEMSNLKHPYIGSEHLLLSLLKYGNKDIVNKFKDAGVTYDVFRNELIKVVGIGKSNNDFYLYTPLLRSILESANIDSSDKGKKQVDTSDLFLALFEEGEVFTICGRYQVLSGVANAFKFLKPHFGVFFFVVGGL